MPRVMSQDLSEQERRVLARCAEGLSVEAVGRELFVAPATVKSHLIRIRQKLEATNTTHAVATAIRRGLI